MFAPARQLIGLVCLLGIAAVAQGADDPKGLEFFEKKIRPILVQHCYECHSSGVKHKGGLLVDTRDGFRKGGKSGPAFLEGKPEESLLLEALNHTALKMPPKVKLPEAVIGDFAHWVKIGAPDPRVKNDVAKKYNTEANWAFKNPVQRPAPPVKNNAWPHTDVDRHVLVKLEQIGIPPIADADRVTLIRRLSYDLIGLPPSPDEVQAYVDDAAANATEKLIDRLLASKHFGERWGRHWLDVAHYAENNGVVKYGQMYPYAYRYRDYVIEAFNSDKPYDQFVREQIAGDLLPAKSKEDREQMQVGTGFLVMGRLRLQQADLQVVMDNIDEQIDATTQGFLGLTVSCARCHDHKFDPITTKDYYALAGIFRSTAMNLGGVGGNKKAGGNGKKKGGGTEVATVSGAWMGVAEGKAANCQVCIRGDVKQLSDTMGRNIPVIFGQKLEIKSTESGRLQLATWLSHPENPLTARVMANRVWHHLFGRGLVPTPDNFGSMSEPCTHPELVDHLAIQFMENGWSVKKLIKSLVLSRTYQLSSGYDKERHEKDPENFYLWRHNMRRLDAEAIRDGMLLTSGQLNREPLKGSLSGQGNANPKKKGPASASPEITHRSVYLPVVRENVNEMMRVFDFADPSLVFGRRDITTVPSQALFLMNSPFVMEQSDHLARRVLNLKSEDSERAALAFQWVLGRKPTQAEQDKSLAFLAEHRKTQSSAGDQPIHRTWINFCQALYQSAEFRYIR